MDRQRKAMARPHKGLNPFHNDFVFYPPVYPYFFGVLFKLTRSLTAVLAAQTAVSALLVPSVGRLGATLFGRRAGDRRRRDHRVSSRARVVLDPLLVGRSCSRFLWWGTERVVRADAVPGGVRLALGGGALWGLATLAREPPLALVPLVAAWLAWRHPGGRRRAGAFVAAATLVILPWAVRNWIVFHAFVPVSTMEGLSLWHGNSGLTHLQVIDALANRGPIEEDRYAMRIVAGHRAPAAVLDLREVRERDARVLEDRQRSPRPDGRPRELRRAAGA